MKPSFKGPDRNCFGEAIERVELSPLTVERGRMRERG